MEIEFEKWEGLGNDFLLVEGARLGPAAVRQLCDRRRGVGGDGVLLIERDPPRMIVINADGSRPEMCGNGLRCVAAYLFDRGALASDGIVTTDAGPKRCRIARTSSALFEVEALMATAPRCTPHERTAHGRRFEGYQVDMGNPHFVVFDVELSHEEFSKFGPVLSQLGKAWWEGGDNVELCMPTDDGQRVRVWERGVGPTDACGTGACAVAWAASMRNPRLEDQVQRIELPGGDLHIRCAASGEVHMRGPARRSFVGTVRIDDGLALDA